MANEIDQAFGTPTGDATLILGDIVFQHMEVPEFINFGGSQMLSIHQLVGGGRVINALGRSDTDISWGGFFFGERAFERARAVDFLRTNGVKVELIFGELIYFGIIKSFNAHLERFYQVPYTITFTVIENLSIPVPVPLPSGYNDAVNADYGAVQNDAPIINNSELNGAVSSLGASINAAGNLNNANAMQLADISEQIQNTQAINDSIIASLKGG